MADRPIDDIPIPAQDLYPMPQTSIWQFVVPAAIVAIVVALIFVAAMHGGPKSAAGPHDVEISVLIPGGDRTEASYDELIPAFEKANPGIKIKRFDIPSQGQYVKMQIMLAADACPDLVPMMTMRLPQYLEHNAFQPLDQFMAEDANFQKFKDDIYPKTFEGFRKDGKLYGMAYSLNLYAMYFNKTLFDQYNQTAPDAQKIEFPNPAWTLERYLQVCHKLTRDTTGGDRIDQWGTIQQDVPLYIICPILRRFGANLFNADQTRCTLDDPKAIAAMKWYFDLSLQEKVAPSPTGPDARSAGTVVGTPSEMFIAGKVALFEAESEWRFDFADQIKDFQWDIAEPPKGPDGQRTSGYECFAMSISHSSRHPREAWKFISFLLSPGGQRILLKNNVGIPVLKSLCTSNSGFLDPSTPPPHKDVYLKTLEYGQDIPALKDFEEVEAAISQQLQFGLLGKKTAEEACRAATREANRVLAEGREE